MKVLAALEGSSELLEFVAFERSSELLKLIAFEGCRELFRGCIYSLLGHVARGAHLNIPSRLKLFSRDLSEPAPSGIADATERAMKATISCKDFILAVFDMGH